MLILVKYILHINNETVGNVDKLVMKMKKIMTKMRIRIQDKFALFHVLYVS